LLEGIAQTSGTREAASPLKMTAWVRGSGGPLGGLMQYCSGRRGSLRTDYFFFSIFAQVSFNATVRLKTDLAGVESESAQKYPRRSNW
jgi:hypothetical protein